MFIDEIFANKISGLFKSVGCGSKVKSEVGKGLIITLIVSLLIHPLLSLRTTA